MTLHLFLNTLVLVLFYGSMSTTLLETESNSPCDDCKTQTNCNISKACEPNEELSLKNSKNLSSLKRNISQEPYCEIPKKTRAKSLQCFSQRGLERHCEGRVPVNTIVSFVCPEFHNVKSGISKCQGAYNWSATVDCIPECGVTKSTSAVPLVMHGREVQPGQWPWAVLIYQWSNTRKQWQFICGGTLIDDNAVLTATHCIYKVRTSELLVRVGSINQTLDENLTMTHKVFHAFILPVYKEHDNGMNSDIAVLLLRSRITLTEEVLPACLPHLTDHMLPGTEGIVAGWGKDERLQPSEQLRFITVPLVNTKQCVEEVPKKFYRYLSFTAFCAGYLNGTGVCQGDSGGGMLVKSEGRWVVQGVVSVTYSDDLGGVTRCRAKSYSLYTKVKIYVDWIKHVLELF